MKETGLTGKGRSTTIAATPDDGKSQRKRRIRLCHNFNNQGGNVRCCVIVISLHVMLCSDLTLNSNLNRNLCAKWQFVKLHIFLLHSLKLTNKFM